MKNVLLVGLGAIGSLVASKFIDTGVDIDVLLDEDRLKRYSKTPLVINGKEYRFSYVTNNTYTKKYDLVMIATKYDALPDAINQLEGIIHKDCTIMSLLNGIDSEEIIGAKFGIERCIYAFITKTDATRVDRNITFQADGKIYFGEKDGTSSQRTKAIAALFDKVKMDYSLTDDIITKQWKKFMTNIGMNQVSAVLGATYGDFLKSEEIISLTSDAMNEAVCVAQAMGIGLNEDDRKRALLFLSDLSPGGKTSMLQDVLAKRKTEVDMLAKALIQLGSQYNVPTPVNKILYQQIKAIESMY